MTLVYSLTFTLPPGWSDDLVKEAWSQDRQGACEKAGLDPDMVELDEADGHSEPARSLSTKEVLVCMDIQCKWKTSLTAT